MLSLPQDPCLIWHINSTIISKKPKICEDIVCGTSESFQCGRKLQRRNERLLPLEKLSSVLDNWTTPAIGFLCKTCKVAASFSFCWVPKENIHGPVSICKRVTYGPGIECIALWRETIGELTGKMSLSCCIKLSLQMRQWIGFGIDV